MHSAGGLVAPAAARKFPIRLLESGPAGGGLATALFGKLAGQDSVISFDMGGTTAKACLVEDGRIEVASMMEAARVHRFKRGSGLPIKAPVIDMIEIGAGGGSIAGIDEVGLLRVGPRSAGADPGPACYGRGGTEATVTDANLVLGFYDPAFFLGGRMTLDRKAAMTAVGKLGEEIGLSAVEAAYGIHKVVTESMAAAARIHLVEKGKDPRAYAMVGFGGAGPGACGRRRAHSRHPRGDHSAGLGRRLVPRLPRRAAELRARALVSGAHRARLRRGGDQRESCASWRPKAARCSPKPASRARRSRSSARADMRLVGQMHEINVPLPAGTIGEASLGAIRTAFAEVYTKRYTSLYGEAAIEAISFRVRVLGPAPELSLNQAAAPPRRRSARARARSGSAAASSRPSVYDRYALVPGDRIEGPAIVEEREATTVVPPGDSLHGRRAISTCASRSASRRRRRRWSRRARRSPTRWRASRPIRSRSRSCGAASSPSWTRCGSP